MFGTIVDKIQALLSRSFLLGNFFPVLICAMVNLVIAWFGIDRFAEYVKPLWRDDTVHSAAVLVVALVAIAIGAFILAPLIPLFRLILEGEVGLPVRLKGWLVRYHTERSVYLDNQLRRVAGSRNELNRVRQSAKETWDAARTDKCVLRPGNDTTLLEKATQTYDKLRDEFATRLTKSEPGDRFPDVATVKEAVGALACALRHHVMFHDESGFNEESERVDRLQGNLMQLLDRINNVGEALFQEAGDQYRAYGVEGVVRPTLLGNARAAIERYSLNAYNVNFEFLWPRLGMVLSKDPEIAALVETATAQVNFSVLMTVLSFVTTGVWIIVLPHFGTSLVAFIAVAVLGPPIVAFFYQLVGASQQAFGAVAATAIDGLRFELMQALHLPLPASIVRERKAWAKLQLELLDPVDEDVQYQHPKKP